MIQLPVPTLAKRAVWQALGRRSHSTSKSSTVRRCGRSHRHHYRRNGAARFPSRIRCGRLSPNSRRAAIPRTLSVEVSVCMARRHRLGAVCFLRLLDSAIHWIFAVSAARTFTAHGHRLGSLHVALSAAIFIWLVRVRERYFGYVQDANSEQI